ncbi:MAG: protein kinase [Nocardioides sp.]|nr:protein kinase [Nocardioides sp.]
MVGDYTLLSRIGEGGMGVVHLARKPGGDRVALKVLRPHIVGDEEARARLAREVGSLRRIRSRWVAEIVDADPWAAIPFVATRYVPGLSLHDFVLEEGQVEGADLTWFAACLAEGVASVHSVGVLHRDVKPSNVLMEGRTPILIDFGLARVADDPKLTHTGWLLGTPGYLAPEILHGDDATPASDVHSWAATVAYAGTGRPPFGRGPSMAIMDRVRRGEHDLTGLPHELGRLVAAALEPDPARRPTLDAILGWLRPQVAPGAAAVPPVPTAAEDLFTLPLALAAQARQNDVTERVGYATPEPAPHTFAMPLDPGRLDPTRVEQPWDAPYVEPRPPLAERLRRGVLLSAGAVAAGALLAAFPWLATGALLLLVWLLRSGSLAASAAGDRRRVRGRRWYDGARFLLAAPWHLVRSIGSTVMLQLWALGLATAGALICYAFAAGVATTLFVSGVVFGASVWTGPGGSRVRSPLSRVVNALSRSGRTWLGAVAVLLVVAALAGLRVAASGTSWTPQQDRPFSSHRGPGPGGR